LANSKLFLDIWPMSAATAAPAPEEKLLAPEEYTQKATELESRLSRIEGRSTKEARLHNWFEEQDLAVTVTQMEKKGIITLFNTTYICAKNRMY